MKTKNEMTTTMLKTELVSVWDKAHTFEEWWKNWEKIPDSENYKEEVHRIVRDLAAELVSEWEKIADDLAPLFEIKTNEEFAKKIGGDTARLAIYCRHWWLTAEEVIEPEEEA